MKWTEPLSFEEYAEAMELRFEAIMRGDVEYLERTPHPMSPILARMFGLVPPLPDPPQ